MWVEIDSVPGAARTWVWVGEEPETAIVFEDD